MLVKEAKGDLINILFEFDISIEAQEIEEVTPNPDEKDLNITEAEVLNTPEDEITPPEEELS